MPQISSLANQFTEFQVLSQKLEFQSNLATPLSYEPNNIWLLETVIAQI